MQKKNRKTSCHVFDILALEETLQTLQCLFAFTRNPLFFNDINTPKLKAQVFLTRNNHLKVTISVCLLVLHPKLFRSEFGYVHDAFVIYLLNGVELFL